MTVTYTHEVANARLGGFSNLLLRWKGSVYKLFYKEFIIYITLYTILSLVYRYVSHSDFKNYFEKLCLQFQSYTDLVPISFVLGFYVSMVVGRWWQQYLNIPWPDRLMMVISANVHGPDYRGRLIRRTLVRYLSLMQVLTYRSISTAVFKRFPTIQHVIDAGFMTQTEYKQYENVKTENVKYFIPCVWFSNLLSKVRQEGRIYDDMTYQTLLKELNDFRGCCGMLFSYDWISIPLVYTQVVTVAVYVFFMSTLLSRQYLDVTKGYPGHEVDLYVPIFTICQFFFYVGWLKVAEQLINPFGEDDDDFDVNMIIDRNLELSMLTVDNMYLSHPKLERDIYWDNPNPAIPYTAAAANHKMDAFLGSTIDMSLDRYEMRFLEQADAPQNKKDNNHLDINHNDAAYQTKTEQNTLLKEPPPFTPKQPPTRTTNPVNFWKRITGKEQESEAKKSLLKMDYLSPRASSNNEKNENKKRSTDNDDILSADSDSDSDVADSSSDDGSGDNRSQRRTSLSSEEGECVEKNNTDDDAPCDSQRSLSAKKHSIGESDDRPKAKKPKNASQPLTNTKDSCSKPKRPDVLVTKPSESDLKKMGGRFVMSRAKKSPKKKVNTTKFLKRRNQEETEDERRNAQKRTIGLLKANKKKSVQALQRNARRTNYPGNAWLRYNYSHPLLDRRDFPNAADYTSMTSGAEDHGRAEYYDSPFGSIISFGTSIPSPRPLRFSQFVKRGRRKNFDSISASSCMTSPCANEDYSPSFGFCNGSPRSREDFIHQPHLQPSTSISMPFTEDLRRRLLVVNTNTPNSSNATSPIMSRAYLGMPESNNHNPFIHTQPTLTQSDDLLMIAPTNGPTTSNTWSGKLEVIGENPTSEKSISNVVGTDERTSEKIKNESLNEPQTSLQRSTQINMTLPKTNVDKTGKTPVPQLVSNQNKVGNCANSKSTRNILRSKSCPDVPISKSNTAIPIEPIEVDNSEKAEDSSSDDEEENTEMNRLLKSNVFQSTATLTNTSRTTSPNHRVSVHWENECNQSNKPDVDEISEIADDVINTSSEYAYKELARYNSSELTPLISPDASIDTSKNEIEQFSENSSKRVISLDNGLGTNTETAKNTTKSIPGHPSSIASDLGYDSAKEEPDGTGSVKRLDPLSKIRDFQTMAPSRNSFQAIAKIVSKEKTGISKGNPTSSCSNEPECAESVVVSEVNYKNDDTILNIV
uniref:uncharacterized protein LOC120331695 isoform X1 n=1 Tax=Styela clava TaxID=7725 RepID=UPI00193A9F2D|nr:uncharacterized protein LOC120331695 isoform X1 [Styela clava]